MKKAIRMLILCLLFACFSSGLADSPKLSLPEVRAATPDAWDEVYETSWRTVTVHVNIAVPEADRFPVLMVRRASGLLSNAEQKQYTKPI